MPLGADKPLGAEEPLGGELAGGVLDRAGVSLERGAVLELPLVPLLFRATERYWLLSYFGICFS